MAQLVEVSSSNQKFAMSVPVKAHAQDASSILPQLGERNRQVSVPFSIDSLSLPLSLKREQNKPF